MNKNLYPGSIQAGILLSIVFVFGFFFRSRAQIITVRVITTYAGNGIPAFGGNGGPATATSLDSSTSCLSMDGYGNLYFSDVENFRIRKVDHSGIITTIAGTGSGGYTGDGFPAMASMLNRSWGVAADTIGNVYLTDQLNYLIREADTSGLLTNIAGTGSPGYNNGPASSAQFGKTLGIAADATGNIYVADPDNSCVRKISPAGTVTTYAGNTIRGYLGDGGQATAAELNDVFGVATDATGNLYICDGGNSCIRKVYTSGIITTIAGTGVPGYNGDGGSALTSLLNQPLGVFADNAGNVFIADYANNRIREINSAGIISTIAGTGAAGYNGDNRLATTAELSHPTSVVLDDSGNVYIADLNNYRIRKISNAWLLSFTGGRSQNIIACEYPTATSLNSVLAIDDYATGLTDKWSLISGPAHGSVTVAYTTTSTGSIVTPGGLSYLPASGYTGNDTFKVSVADGHATDTTTIYVTVITSSPPAGVITGDSSVCEETTITLSDSVSGGTWSSSNNTAKVSGGVVTGIASGADTITYTITTPCATVSTTKAIMVNKLPNTGTITGASAVCAGATILLSDNITGGTWSTVNAKASVFGVSTGGLVTGLSAGTDTIKYTVSNTYCTAAASYGITIDTFTNIGIITGPSTVCVGSQASLSDTIAGGAWSSSNTNAGVSSGIITGNLAGTDTISYSTTNSCGTATANYYITIEPLPATPAISQDEYILSGPTGYSSYEWTGDGLLIPAAVADTYFVVNAGMYAVIVFNSFGCAATSPPVTCGGCTITEMKIYPNPTASVVSIDWCKKVTVRITCMDGKELQLIRNVNSVDLGDMPNADYILSIFDADGHKVSTRCISKVAR